MGKLVWVFGGVFGGVGIALLAAGIVALHSTREFREGALSAPGTVVDFDSAKPVVEFVDQDGATHRIVGSVSSNPPAFDLGERVTVRYRPGEPAQARIDSFLESGFLPILLGGMGTVFSSIGAGFLIWEVRKRRQGAWLQQFGLRVQAKYTGVRLDTSVRVNGRNPWRLTAQWQNPATGLVHSFESEVLLFDPSDYVRRDTVEVWVDTNDPSRHHLDTTFLPKHAGA